VLRPLGPVDAVLLDETSGLRSGGSGHHGLIKFAATRARMFEEGVIGEDTRLVAHHFSHNGGLTHAELVERLGSMDVIVSYDGLTLTL
jgi:phosphoribosyl 1,2-cyclic phosphate phosphodiesterase